MNSLPGLVVASLCLSLGLALVGCGSSDSGDDNSPPGGGLASNGEDAVNVRGCKGCHQEDMAGTTQPLSDTITHHADTVAYSANLTSDKDTGLGNWTDKQIHDSIVAGLDI